jgi:hypothetical protein
MISPDRTISAHLGLSSRLDIRMKIRFETRSICALRRERSQFTLSSVQPWTEISPAKEETSGVATNFWLSFQPGMTISSAQTAFKRTRSVISAASRTQDESRAFQRDLVYHSDSTVHLQSFAKPMLETRYLSTIRMARAHASKCHASIGGCLLPRNSPPNLKHHLCYPTHGQQPTHKTYGFHTPPRWHRYTYHDQIYSLSCCKAVIHVGFCAARSQPTDRLPQIGLEIRTPRRSTRTYTQNV